MVATSPGEIPILGLGGWGATGIWQGCDLLLWLGSSTAAWVVIPPQVVKQSWVYGSLLKLRGFCKLSRLGRFGVKTRSTLSRRVAIWDLINCIMS